MKKRKKTCECSDPGCPAHTGIGSCSKRATRCLRRSDMDDKTGTLMCQSCGDDAEASGLFFSDIGAFIRS